MKNFVRFFQSTLPKYTSLAFVLLLVCSIVFIAIKWSQLPPQIPLYYSMPWGEKQLASPWELTILPTLAVSIFTTNLLFTYFLLKNDELLTKIAIFAGFFISALLFYSFFRIIVLVT